MIVKIALMILLFVLALIGVMSIAAVTHIIFLSDRKGVTNLDTGPK